MIQKHKFLPLVQQNELCFKNILIFITRHLQARRTKFKLLNYFTVQCFHRVKVKAQLGIRIAFTDQIPLLMRAADVLLTKAGPSTIAEAVTSRLPLLLYDYLPGQETGNKDFVVNHGLGSFAPTVPKALATLSLWLHHPDLLASIKKSMARFSFHQSADLIARHLISADFPHPTSKTYNSLHAD